MDYNNLMDYDKEILKRLIIVQQAMDFCVHKVMELNDRIDKQDDIIKGMIEMNSGYDKYKKKVWSRH